MAQKRQVQQIKKLPAPKKDKLEDAEIGDIVCILDSLGEVVNLGMIATCYGEKGIMSLNSSGKYTNTVLHNVNWRYPYSGEVFEIAF